MAVILFPLGSFTGGASGEGQTFTNAATLSKLGTDANGNLTFNGRPVGEKSVEVSYSITLSDENIRSCSIELPNDCDASRSISFALQGISAQQGKDWTIQEHSWPDPDVISWDGLGLQTVAKSGDYVLISYYKKL